MRYIIVDLEMNPLAADYKTERAICPTEIIEIGAVAVSDDLTVLEEFQQFVKPQYNTGVSERMTALTGITTGMVEDAPCFTEAVHRFITWCGSFGEDYEVFAWSDNDERQMAAEAEMKKCSTKELMMFLGHWHDFQDEFRERLGLEKPMSLDMALKYANIDFAGRQHDALDDARNTATLFSIVRDTERCERVLKPVLDVLRPKEISDTLGDLFNFTALTATTKEKKRGWR